MLRLDAAFASLLAMSPREVTDRKHNDPEAAMSTKGIEDDAHDRGALRIP